MAQLAIFLDDGGVMNDGRERHTQWNRMVAEFFAPRLGGTPEAWSAANTRVITGMLQPQDVLQGDRWLARLAEAKDYASFDRQYWVDWLRGMCELVGVPTPAADECVALGHEVSGYITPRTRAAFPGVVDAIRALHRDGHLLHTASGESSADLDGYLHGMGVRACFRRLYGPDLLDTFKSSPQFYRSLFQDAGVAPHDAVVVDDSVVAVSWAAEAGARTVLIGAAPSSGTNATLCIGSLAELPARIRSLS